MNMWLYLYTGEMEISACSFWKRFSPGAALILPSGLVKGKGISIATAFRKRN